ncbi:MAG TPA: hypothetical protein VMB23_01770, partial [Spirochaetia bacterium]|nr:hypothetical protein [Spirochaetia bacterium]
ALLQMDAHDSESAGEESVAETLAQHPDLAIHSPLLGSVLALNLPENDTTANLSGESRSELTHHLLTTLWQRRSAQEGQPLAFILEDAHWFDEASWRLLSAMLRDLPDALVVVTTRPVAPGTVSGFDAVTSRSGTDRLTLEALAPQAAVAVVRGRLGVDHLPDSLEAFLTQRGEGNPFYSLELALALVDTGLLVVEGRHATLTQKFKGWQNLPFPDTLQGAIASRVDRLPTDSQGILKVAVVIGRNFLQRTVEGVVGDPSATVADLTVPLDALRKSGLILEQEGVALPSYEFQHAVIQRVTYDLLLHQQRLDLHRRVAQWYEAQYGDGAVSFAAVVGYHWREAGDFAKAVRYFRHAGLVSLKNFSNLEAISLLEEALKLDNALPVPTLDRRTRAEIDLALGEAFIQSTRYPEVIHHLERGLEGLGQPIPQNPGHLAGAVLISLARRLSLGTARGVTATVPDAERTRLTAVGTTLITLTEIYGGTNNLPKAVYSAMVGTRWVEKLGLATETARGLAYCSVVFDFLGMKGQAAQLVARAEALLETVPASRNRMLTDLAIGFFHAGRAQLDDAFRDFDRLGRDAATIGDHRRHRDALNMQTLTLSFAGRFAEALDWA